MSREFAAALGGAIVGGGIVAWIGWYIVKRNILDMDIECRERKRAGRPTRLIFIRHGESLGNIDSKNYETIPDNKMPLTKEGQDQAREAGEVLKELVDGGTVRWFVSPYRRTVQTFHGLIEAFGYSKTNLPPGLRMSPQIREQDFGNFQKVTDMDLHMQDRHKFGRFWFRFPFGESGADVFDRVDAFISNLSRQMDGQYPGGPSPHYDNYVFVTHGLTMRLLCMRYLRWSVEQFEQVWNPGNCEAWVLQKNDASHSYELVTKVRYGDDATEDRRVLSFNMRTTEEAEYHHVM
jgi:broad specificity phosphatase PhoE